MRPDKMRGRIDGSVSRDGLSAESYQKLEDATGVSELKEVLLEIFEPSKGDDDQG